MSLCSTYVLLLHTDCYYICVPILLYMCPPTTRFFSPSDFYGRDLPAYRPEDKTVLVNKEAKTYAASCGGRHEKTKRLCGCG